VLLFSFNYLEKEPMKKVLRLGCSIRHILPKVMIEKNDFRQYANTFREMGLSAAICPIVKLELREELRQAFADEDVMLAEVPAYNLNILDPNEEQRHKNIELLISRLRYADEVGAISCVMHGGWVGSDGFSSGGAGNFSKESIEKMVLTLQQILDEVNPKHTKLLIETESDILPDGPEEYLELIEAVNRPSFRAHFDPVNIITSPRRYHFNSDFLRKCFKLLGHYIVSCHAKDVWYANDEKYYPVVRIDEVGPPGRGKLDYRTYLNEIAKLNPSPPLILEHLPGKRELLEGRDFLYKIAQEIDVSFLYSKNVDS
jgi:sugar phosphate isomerase/epimerase